ncbi:MAG: LysR family transcriptional regulator, partial [Gammaproteobacteria bacterium]|nr:LysR family transcriptional regulator [Gammaproteobacteria bacterium]
TEAGDVMLRRSRILTQQIEDLELLAASIDMGWEPEIRIAVELVYPKKFLYLALAQFHPLSRGSRIQIIDTVITGTTEIILEGKADLVIAATGVIPRGYLGEPICVAHLIPVIGAMHPLAQHKQLDLDELSQHLQIVIRDTATKPMEGPGGWLKAEQRWTVSNFYEAIEILKSGIGFSWLPDHLVNDLIAEGILCRLPLTQSSERLAPMSLLTPKEEKLGPGSRQLRQLILAIHGKTGSQL